LPSPRPELLVWSGRTAAAADARTADLADRLADELAERDAELARCHAELAGLRGDVGAPDGAGDEIDPGDTPTVQAPAMGAPAMGVDYRDARGEAGPG
jgi:hypothetical protein